MRILSAEDLSRLLPMRDAIAVVADACGRISRNEGLYPQRIHMPLAEGDALVMPGYDGGSYLGMKVVTLHTATTAHSRPGTSASYLLTDARTGKPVLLCDGTSLTALRTGAASGLATRRLATTDASTVALFGAGGQASTQIDAMFAVRPIQDVRVVGRSDERADAFVRDLKRRYPGARIARCDAKTAIAGASIIVTATSSSTPVFDVHDVGPGTHVNAIGSYRGDMREFDSVLLRNARIVVEQRAAALAEAGELIDAIAKGLVDAGRIIELGEIGENVRVSPDEITVFKSVGHAALDLCTATELLRRSVQT